MRGIIEFLKYSSVCMCNSITYSHSTVRKQVD